VDQAVRQGYILTPYFAEQLPVFEKQPQGMRFYFEEMVKGIDPAHETARLSQVTFDKGQQVRVAKQVTIALPAPVLSPSAKTLEKAEDLYSDRKLDGAKELYLKSLEQQGSPQEHAQAWYGLARISVLGNQPDAAVKLFQKTLEASPDNQTKAWSYVYLARLARAAGEPQQAAKFYKAGRGWPWKAPLIAHAKPPRLNQRTFRKTRRIIHETFCCTCTLPRRRIDSARPGAKGGPSTETQAEAQAVQAMLQAQDPDARVQAADALVTKFANTDFKSLAFYIEADAYQQKNDTAKAIVFGEQALQVDPNNFDASALLANVLASSTRDNRPRQRR